MLVPGNVSTVPGTSPRGATASGAHAGGSGTQAEEAQSFLFKCESGERRVDFVEMLVLAELYGVDISFFRP